jgi:hypothetical protein
MSTEANKALVRRHYEEVLNEDFMMPLSWIA